MARSTLTLGAVWILGGIVSAQTTERVSVDSSGNQGNGGSIFPSISGDGRCVAFRSEANNLVPGDTNTWQDVFVHDRQTGATERVSVDSSGNQGNGVSISPSISGDGRFVAFESSSSNLVPGDTNSAWDIFVHDRQTNTTERVSLDSSGNQANAGSGSGCFSISVDGRYVAFYSLASNLVPGDTNGAYDVFVHDRQAGATERVSVDSSGTQGNNHSGGCCGANVLAISGDGLSVAFQSNASNLVPADTNGFTDVFVHDRQTGTTERVSVDSSGTQGNKNSYVPSISEDGRFATFYSDASNLALGDTNGFSDAFLHDRHTGTTERISVDSSGNQGNGASAVPSISRDGRYVAFYSSASNLVLSDTNGFTDVFVRDRGCASGNINYCAPGISASGCTAAISSTGTASVTAPSGFTLTASGVEGKKDGLFFYGQNGQQANPWGNGTSYQCVVPPVKRAGVLAGTGTAGACDGSFSQDLNAFWCPTCPKPNHAPNLGQRLQVQLWYRDPNNTSNQSTSLSDAVEVDVCP